MRRLYSKRWDLFAVYCMLIIFWPKLAGTTENFGFPFLTLLPYLHGVILQIFKTKVNRKKVDKIKVNLKIKVFLFYLTEIAMIYCYSL